MDIPTFLKNDMHLKVHIELVTQKNHAFTHSHSLIKLFSSGVIDCILTILTEGAAGLGGSVGCTVRLKTRRSRVQPPPRSATFFRGD